MADVKFRNQYQHFTKAEVRLLYWALGITIDSERELIECHSHMKDNPVGKQVIDGSRACIERLRALQRKLAKPKPAD